MTTTHKTLSTPGPWTFEPMTAAICAGSQTLAAIKHQNRPIEENEANGRLLSHAPDLCAIVRGFIDGDYLSDGGKLLKDARIIMEEIEQEGDR
jgi:hypothetical protein